MGLSVIQLPLGTRVASNYVLEGLLGRGGMGCVYRARQESTDSACALKLLDPQFIVTSAHEPKISSRIESDHVVKVLDAGTDDKLGVRWIAMELLDGWDLETFVEHHGALQGESATQALEQLFHAIAAAHRAEVAHCDLKPNNVFLHRPKEASPLPFKIKVLDFGVAKRLSGGVAQHSTAGMGAPGWIAPERCRGQRRNQASDVYCLGLLAFYVITGKEFWVHAQGDDFDPVAVMGEVLFEPMPSASQRAAELGAGHLVPPGFDSWFARCTDREPSHRYPDAGPAWAGLKGVLEAIRSRESYTAQERPSVSSRVMPPFGAADPIFSVRACRRV
jgi:serine/threonine protein kinase